MFLPFGVMFTEFRAVAAAPTPRWAYGWEWRMGSFNGVGRFQAANQALRAIGAFLNDRLGRER